MKLFGLSNSFFWQKNENFGLKEKTFSSRKSRNCQTGVVSFSTGVFANGSYAVTEVYCNGELYPEHFTPSPVMDANESFSLAVERP